ncbi:uncharacterized protein LOC116412706 [Galleria mellonella]|uniref:Uncharacterized protein LOC116412706 n=1 Tax=Galleria mellonella TaxID=7137 RepID=A0A6J3BX33_GALME|nr:uncharacterized protein LOC116412706 [Galleria mellonella]
MIRQAFFVVTISLIFLEIHRTNSYKTLKDLKEQYKKIENDDFTTSDVLVGKAMDFIYSNKTIMSLIARELWNVGSKAIDRIVDMKGPGHKR